MQVSVVFAFPSTRPAKEGSLYYLYTSVILLDMYMYTHRHVVLGLRFGELVLNMLKASPGVLNV